MLYVLKKNNLLYLTETPRSPEEYPLPELLYTLGDLTWTEALESTLRPWKNLAEGGGYRLNLLRELPGILYQSGERQKEVWGPEIKRTIKEYTKALEELGVRSKDVDTSQVRFYCDIINILEETYGEETIWLVGVYLGLTTEEKEFLRKLRGLKTGKSEFLSREIRNPSLRLELIQDFLPVRALEELKLFGGEVGGGNTSFPQPEFLDPSPVVPPTPDLPEIMYKEFSLGEDLTGEEIKSRLTRVYQVYGIPGTPKIQDLWEYFEISPSRSRVSGVRGYRIDTRKLL